MTPTVRCAHHSARGRVHCVAHRWIRSCKCNYPACNSAVIIYAVSMVRTAQHQNSQQPAGMPWKMSKNIAHTARTSRRMIILTTTTIKRCWYCDGDNQCHPMACLTLRGNCISTRSAGARIRRLDLGYHMRASSCVQNIIKCSALVLCVCAIVPVQFSQGRTPRMRRWGSRVSATRNLIDGFQLRVHPSARYV